MAETPGGWSDPVADKDLPPGQHWVTEMPRLSCGAPPAVTTADWGFVLATEEGPLRRWDWAAFRALPSQGIAVDLHDVDGWSVSSSLWEAASVHRILDGVPTSAEYVVVHSYGDWTTVLPLEDLLEMPTWLAFSYGGRDLSADQGGPVRLLVPHLYLFKSTPWVAGMTLTVHDRPEHRGSHLYGDPWREQRFQLD